MMRMDSQFGGQHCDEGRLNGSALMTVVVRKRDSSPLPGLNGHRMNLQPSTFNLQLATELRAPYGKQQRMDSRRVYHQH
jgi:hypothetical protein